MSYCNFLLLYILLTKWVRFILRHGLSIQKYNIFKVAIVKGALTSELAIFFFFQSCSPYCTWSKSWHFWSRSLIWVLFLCAWSLDRAEAPGKFSFEKVKFQYCMHPESISLISWFPWHQICALCWFRGSLLYFHQFPHCYWFCQVYRWQFPS